MKEPDGKRMKVGQEFHVSLGSAAATEGIIRNTQDVGAVLIYSHRSATIGSTRMARRAGM